MTALFTFQNRANERFKAHRQKKQWQRQVKTSHRASTAIADISSSAICCHSNETRSLTANPHNTAQLEGNPYHSPKLHQSACSSVGMRRGTDRHTDGRGQYKFPSAMPHVKCKQWVKCDLGDGRPLAATLQWFVLTHSHGSQSVNMPSVYTVNNMQTARLHNLHSNNDNKNNI